MKVAVAIYVTKFGSEPILFKTNKLNVSDLPPLTDELLQSVGAADPNIDGNDEDGDEEWADWLEIYDYDSLPTI